MKEFFATIRRWKEYITDLERIYEKLQVRGEPTPSQVIVPLLYKHFGNKIPDRDLTGFLGAYLSNKNPAVREYFMNAQSQQDLEMMMKLLEEHCEEKK